MIAALDATSGPGRNLGARHCWRDVRLIRS
jgi:hypothetical protein